MKIESYSYKNADGETVLIEGIPSDEINSMRRENGLTHSEALKCWMYENGKIDAIDQTILDKRSGKVAKPVEKKKRVRKADDVKVALVASIFAHLSGMNSIDNLTVVNDERLIAFNIGDDKYEITLAKKRPAK